MSATKTFTINGKAYRADAETFQVVQSLIPSAKETGDGTAVQAAIIVGIKTGCIVELEKYEQ